MLRWVLPEKITEVDKIGVSQWSQAHNDRIKCRWTSLVHILLRDDFTDFTLIIDKTGKTKKTVQERNPN